MLLAYRQLVTIPRLEEEFKKWYGKPPTRPSNVEDYEYICLLEEYIEKKKDEYP